jgi:hypothetical protein
MAEIVRIPRRINMKIRPKTMPFSLRKFIQDIMSDETKFNTFAESPITAMLEANVPIDATKFTKEDAEHLVRVMGKVQALVKMNNLSGDVKFEDVFNVVAETPGRVAIVSPESHTRTWRHISPDTVTITERDHGITQGFYRDGLNLVKIDEIFTAPLISRTELNDIMVLIENRVDTQMAKMYVR